MEHVTQSYLEDIARKLNQRQKKTRIHDPLTGHEIQRRNMKKKKGI